MKPLTLTILFAALATTAFAQTDPVSAPPRELVESWKLPAFYRKHTDVGGFPILASEKVSDHALREAAFLIRQMIGHRSDLLGALATNHVRFVIMAPSEMTTDVPEHADLTPKSYWDRRARGLGASRSRPAVSCGEENLLDLPGDPYAAENILIHEFSHAIHEMALSRVDRTFDTRLKAAFDNAKTNGLWRGTYASVNRMEYWAEAAQSWFDCNRANDKEHNDVDTREKLKAYDPEIAKLAAEVFGDRPWRYKKPAKRPEAERAHLAGFDRTKAPRFTWPASPKEPDIVPLAFAEPGKAPAASTRTEGGQTSVLFVNQRAGEVSVDWLDFDGKVKSFATIRPGMTHLQSTYAGHVWRVIEAGKPLGIVTATNSPGRIIIK